MGRARRGRSGGGRGPVSAHAAEVSVPATLQIATVVLSATRQAPRPSDRSVRCRRAPRSVLRRMLLDADGLADRFRRNEFGVDADFRGADPAGKGRPIRRTGRPGDGGGAAGSGCRTGAAPGIRYPSRLIERHAMTTTEQRTKWHLRGRGYEFCNCNPGCTCNFSGFPSSSDGSCKAFVGNHILEGSCGDGELSGIKAIAVLDWPHAIHDGGGKVAFIV